MDERSLQLIEYFQVTAAIAERAASTRGQAALSRWRPIADPGERGREIRLLDEGIRRAGEPGEWCAVGPGDLLASLDRLAREAPEGERLLDVLGWLEAARWARDAWEDSSVAERLPALAALVGAMDPLDELRAGLSRALDPEGGVRDGASPALRRLRSALSEGERRLSEQMERWARSHGPEAYVTRHGERFVAMVPGAGFPRRRGIVHDVSGTGLSLLVEPLEFCGENNRLIETRRAAFEEERRILADLARQVLAAEPALRALEETLVHLDTLCARARWARPLGGTAIAPEGATLRLRRARHPLLAMGVGGSGEVVPLELELGSERAPGRVLLVSGPNMGGKSVLLKTVALTVCLAHAALPVLAEEGSRVPELEVVLADIGDEQSLAQGLSTFAAHLAVLARMAESAGPRTLVLCDELGAGTDPEDGSALARSFLEHVTTAGAWAVITTHLGSLKRLVGEIPGIESGSLEFDVATLTSRYRFLPGVPGASHALEVAERLGFPRPLLERARALRPREAAKLESLLEELAGAARRARAESEALQEARRAAEQEAASHHEAAESLRREEAALRRRLTRESEAVLARAREVWQLVQREARREEKSRGSAEVLRQELKQAEERLAGLAPAAPDRPAPPTPQELVPGTRVRIVDLGVEADVTESPDAEGRVQLRRGSWTIQSHVAKLARVESAPAAPQPAVRATWSAPEEGAPIEVDLRGMDVTDALESLDRGVDRAVLAGFGELRVIHGVGKGVLRHAVEKHLRGHPQVAGQRPGQVGEGGRGVTVARLR